MHATQCSTSVAVTHFVVHGRVRIRFDTTAFADICHRTIDLVSQHVTHVQCRRALHCQH
jgi:hypothetical protein